MNKTLTKEWKDGLDSGDMEDILSCSVLYYNWSFDNLAIYTGLWEHQKTFAIQVRSPVLSNVPIALHPVKNPLGHSNYFIESSTNQEKLQYRAFGCIGILKDMLLWSWIPVIIEARYHFMSSRDIMDVSDVSLICTWPMKQSYPTEKQSYEKKTHFSGTLPMAWCQIWW